MNAQELWLASPLRQQMIEARSAARLSQSAAARWLKMGAGSLSAYEAGRRVPSAPVLEYIFDHYERELIAAPKGTPGALAEAAAEAAGQLRALADRLDRSAPSAWPVAA